MLNLLIVCLLCVPVLSVLHGKDDSVCTPPQNTNTGPTRPKLPSVYSVHTECNILNNQNTVDSQEWYDGSNNRALVSQTSQGLRALGYYYYNDNELLVINPQPASGNPTCKVQDLATSDNNFMFGLQRFRNGSDGTYPAGSAFEFGGNIPEMYLGRQTVRGIQTDAWKSCVYWKSLDSTMNVTWYYTAQNIWQTASNTKQVPVRCHVTGRRFTDATTSYDFDHIYEFSDFLPYIDLGPKVFEVPDNTICPGRKNTKPLPQFGMYFKMKSELIVPTSSFVTFMWEWYDFSTKMSKFQYRPVPTASTYRTNMVSEIHDYNTGTAYVIDTVDGNCTVHAITGLDSVKVDPTHVKMVSTQDFQHSVTGTLAYDGVRAVRGIDCDVWVEERNDWPAPGSGVNSTWEFLYATPIWLSQHGYGNNSILPVQLSIAAASLPFYSTYNIYEYDDDEPSLLDFDITPCFGPTHKKDMKFVLPAQYSKLVSDEMTMFRYFILVTVAGYTTVSPIRITNIQVSFLDSKDVLVSFRLLDKAPLPGDVVNPATQLSLEDAVDILKYGINSGNFTININGVIMKPRPYSVSSKDTVIVEHPWKNVKLEYAGGSVVGLGVGMLVVAFGIGFVVYMVIKKRRS
ncbi:uncharacterized protein LOC124289197 [Haliotis rubra]|uniref:uncharacterized protein LOC124289197 n=1 Tax=Haliotis rubra TaxID=36100 RepID=UPI001EE505C6|nr:uncharacterized protein LOC124289197 [Haliotis rubra]